jgi:type III restriction enzyme
LRNTRPFVAKDQGYFVPKRSVFNRIIGDRGFELDFASFLETCPEDDVISYAKNYLAVGFKLDYVKADGEVSNYFPDFLVKLPKNRLAVVETKGREELDLPNKMARLKQWCGDLNSKQSKVAYYYVYVDQESFEKYRPATFAQLQEGFREYQ